MCLCQRTSPCKITLFWCKCTPYQWYCNTQLVFTQLQEFTLFWCYHNTLTFCVNQWEQILTEWKPEFLSCSFWIHYERPPVHASLRQKLTMYEPLLKYKHVLSYFGVDVKIYQSEYCKTPTLKGEYAESYRRYILTNITVI